MAEKHTSNASTITYNRKARFNYAISEEIEAGIVLQGTEVKSLRLGYANIVDAHASEKGGELWLLNLSIEEYPYANRFNHEPKRPRKLLLHKKQIKKLFGKLQTKGMTLIPLSLYFNAKGVVKVKLGLATGKKLVDKRETIKNREWERDKARALKHN